MRSVRCKLDFGSGNGHQSWRATATELILAHGTVPWWLGVQYDGGVIINRNRREYVVYNTQKWNWVCWSLINSFRFADKFDLVCDRDIYPTIGLAALNTGGPVGVYLFGVLNDRLGRRISFFTCLTTLLAGSFLTVMSVNFWMWAVSRVIVGLTIPAVYQIPFIIGKLRYAL